MRSIQEGSEEGDHARLRSGMRKWIVTSVLAIVLLAACGAPEAVPTEAPATQPPATEAPTAAPTTEVLIPVTGGEETPAAEVPSILEQLSKVDEALKQSLPSSIAYNAPDTMRLGETTTIEFLLNPSMERQALEEQVTGGGPIVSATIQINPRMKVELKSPEEEAFTILPLHDSPEQFISSSETTRWSWDVTPKEGGLHQLTLVVYRLITVEGTENWRQVETYRSNIDVKVTVVQRILSLDWKWIGSILATLLAGGWLIGRKRGGKPAR